MTYNTNNSTNTNSMSKTVFILLVLLVAMVIYATVMGVAFTGKIYGNSSEFANQKAACDIPTLVLIIPLLIVASIFFRKSNLAALCLPGILYYLVYSYIPYIFDVQTTPMTLVYLLIVALSVVLMITLIASLSLEKFKSIFDGNVKKNLIGVILLCLALFVFAFQVVDIISYVTKVDSGYNFQKSLYFADLVIAVPILLVAAVLVLRRRALGYIISFSILFGYLLQCIGLIPFFYIYANLQNAQANIEDVIAISVMIVVCTIPLISFFKALKKKNSGE